MQRDDERDEETNAAQPERLESPEETPDLPSSDVEAEGDEFAELPEASGEPRSLAGELTALREAEAETAADGEMASDAGISFAADAPESIAASEGTAMPASPDELAELAESPPPRQSSFGPITRIDDLPQDILASLDAESAANLSEAIKHPEQFPPDYLDQTTIRNLFSATPVGGAQPGAEDRPWHEGQFPPLRLEVNVLNYELMVDKAIERVGNRLDDVHEQKMDQKIASAMFGLRCELRTLFR